MLPSGPAIDVQLERTRMTKWVEYRTQTVTDLVRAVYREAKAAKPRAWVSAAVFFNKGGVPRSGIESTTQSDRPATIRDRVERRRLRLNRLVLDASHGWSLWTLADNGWSMQRPTVAHGHPHFFSPSHLCTRLRIRTNGAAGRRRVSFASGHTTGSAAIGWMRIAPDGFTTWKTCERSGSWEPLATGYQDELAKVSGYRLDKEHFGAVHPFLAQADAEPAVAVPWVDAHAGTVAEFLQVVLRPGLAEVG